MQHWIISYQYWLIVFCDDCHRTGARHHGNVVPEGYTVMDDRSIEACLHELTQGRHNVWVWCRNDMRHIVDYMMSQYIYIKAAGGIVHSAPHLPGHPSLTDDRILLINRNDHWDMAKGKVEPGETLRQAAIREVTEETGLSIASEGRLVMKTYHIYDLYGGWHLKQTSWFEMQDSGSKPIVPQEEEGITTAEWCPIEVWRKRLEESYSMMALIAHVYCHGQHPLATHPRH